MDGARSTFRLFRCATAAGLALWLGVPASAAEPDGADAPDGAAPAAAEAGPEPRPAGEQGKVEYQCDRPGSDGEAVIDRMQQGVYLSVCGTARWFDGLFGTRRFDQDSDATFGRLRVTEFWDQRDGASTRVRMRARLALPTAQKRLKLLFGRVDDKEINRDAQADAGPDLPSSFRGVDDEAWLLGLGYSRQGKLEQGFDFSAGIKIKTPVDPYVKGTYRHDFVFGEDTTLRARQTLFWRDSRGYGETTEVSVDRLLGKTVLLRWDNGATLAEDVRRLEWYSSLITFQSLGDRRGMAYTAFVSGIANTDVPVRNYGVEVKYRRRMLRKWLFLEARSSLTWPRDTLEESRDIDPGVGLGFEMYFGPVPERDLR